MTSIADVASRRTVRGAIAVSFTILAIELLAIGSIFNHAIDFTCNENWPRNFCRGSSLLMVGLYCCIGSIALMIALRRAPYSDLTQDAGGRIWPLGINLVGTAVAFVPILMLAEGTGTAALVPTLFCWAIGLVLIVAGLGLFLAPLGRWSAFFASQWRVLFPILAIAMTVPFLAVLLRPIWNIDAIATATFYAVGHSVIALGYDVTAYVGDKAIGYGDFFVLIAPACSGVEGIALVTLFVTIYLTLFRKDLKFPKALLLYPIGILTSCIFNVIRIVILIVIGLEGHPELAVGGFHSHAGWLMFTFIALGIIYVSQSLPYFKKDAGKVDSAKAPLLPISQDAIAASILPFSILMLSALLVSAFSETPGVVYPVRVVMMLGVLAFFVGVYRALPWRLNPVAIAAGVAIGIVWIAIPVDAADAVAPYGALTGLALLGWFVMRGIGTAFVIPIVEELFFRGYLEKKIGGNGGINRQLVAALVTAGLFAALHDRWVEAFFASLVLSYIARRNGNITDAIVAHAVANALIFGAAALTGNVHII